MLFFENLYYRNTEQKVMKIEIGNWLVRIFRWRKKSPELPKSQLDEDFITWLLKRIENTPVEQRKGLLRLVKFEPFLTGEMFLDIFLDLLVCYSKENNCETMYLDDFEQESKNALQAVKTYFATELAEITQ